MTTHIVLLNGPPSSGKDAIGAEIRSLMDNVVILKISQHLRDHMCSLLGIQDHELESIYDDPHPQFNWKTPRSAMIDYCENYLKPTFGNDILGRHFISRVRRINPPNKTIIATDSGFASEARPIVNTFGFSRVLLVHLFREGKDFSNCSRSYIQQVGGLTPLEVTNNGTIREAAIKVMHHIKKWNL